MTTLTNQQIRTTNRKINIQKHVRDANDLE